MPRTLYYGPGIGEHWRDANFGPLGPLQAGDAAVSPNLVRARGLRLGDSFEHNGQTYRYADPSYKRPGVPTKDVVEVWMPPNSGPQSASSPGPVTDNPFADPSWLPTPIQFGPQTDPFQYLPPSDVSVPPSQADLPSQFMNGPQSATSSPQWLSDSQPNFDFNQYLNAPSDSAGPRPNFLDLSQFSPSGSLDQFAGPQFAQAAPDDLFANTGVQPFDVFAPPSGSIWNQDPISQSIGGTDISNFANIDIGADLPPSPDIMSSPGEVTDNPFADPAWTTPTSESSSGEVTDNPFADSSWLPPSESSAAGGVAGAAGSALSAPMGGIQGGSGLTGFNSAWSFSNPSVGPQFSYMNADPSKYGGNLNPRTAGFDPFGGGTGGYMAIGGGGPESGIAIRSMGDGGRDSKHGQILEGFNQTIPQYLVGWKPGKVWNTGFAGFPTQPYIVPIYSTVPPPSGNIIKFPTLVSPSDALSTGTNG